MNFFIKAITNTPTQVVDTTFVSIIERLSKEHNISEENIVIVTKLAPTNEEKPHEKHVGFMLLDGRGNKFVTHLDMKKYL
ncbi:MAG: hypothetical protein EXR21_10415 [Flavobacteriaceae bacterium]|nr:hypothetical protein [Flavobacteriaceae bacterium]